MSSRKKRLKNFKLYGVTSLLRGDASELRKIEQALKGGVDVLQLRSKTLSDRELIRVGLRIKILTAKYQSLFIVNDRPDICCILDADGVHLGQDDLPVVEVRRLLPKDRLIGKSTHGLNQARATLKEPVDYIGCGPIFLTPTKPSYKKIGIGVIGKVMALSRVPVVCIGGIDLENVHQVKKAGANRVAVVRALFDVPDPKKVARQFQEILK